MVNTPTSNSQSNLTSSRLKPLAATVAGFAAGIFCLVSAESLLESNAALSATTRGGIVALQLAPTPATAETILKQWNATPLTNRRTGTLLDAARDNVHRDFLFIASYSALWLVSIWILRAWTKNEPRLNWVVFSIAATGLGAATFDVLENLALLEMIDEYSARKALAVGQWLSSAANCFAIGKFVLAMGTLVFLLIGLVASFRWQWLQRAPQSLKKGDFKQLYLKELESLTTTQVDAGRVSTETGPAGEPWIRSPFSDHVGLAFSGGGIRSATFNLGVLQGLHSFGLLDIFQYFTTISGGGYIGAWWTVWRKRNPQTEFPEGRHGLKQEPEAIRHLREFSMFLSPRWGFFETEMWNGFVAVSSGMLPTLAMSFCLLANALFCFLLLTLYHVWPSRLVGIGTAMLLTLVMNLCLEAAWRRSGKGTMDSVAHRSFVVTTLASLLLIPFIWIGWSGLLQRLARGSEWPLIVAGRFAVIADPGTWNGWWELVGLRDRPDGLFISPRLFDLGVIWLVTGLLVATLRAAVQSIGAVDFQRSLLPPFDRVLQRLLAAGLVWCVAATIWHAGSYIAQSALQISLTAGGAAGSAGIFAWLRNWLGKAVEEGDERRLLTRLKPKLPQLLAYFTVTLAAVAVAAVLNYALRDRWAAWYICMGATWLVLGLSLFLNPTEVALHSFYRGRISRAYLGASNTNFASAQQNRQTDVADADDLRLPELLDGAGKCRSPVHLVCCAANDLAGDHLANLGRGSRSAVLSCHGFAVGNHWAERPFVRFSSAVTASAAAFNSHMGTVSRHLGPAVAFLMASLNLRLGLWMRHPAIDSQVLPIFPGLLLLREMIGQTRCGLRNVNGVDMPTADDVHLSDGAHFENLGLYELVRRHCRYILMTDCGADPEAEFSDFGNAVRRIREDFNIDIEIDLTPLKPDDIRFAKQHMVVGTIHYDDVADKGVLLYFKPNLTGDEPSDVLQYAKENEDFPQETTLDQFYDESQWEAYRRLGEHSLRSGLRFLENFPAGNPRTAQRIFGQARWEWYPKPPDFEDRFLDLTQRCTQIDSMVQDRGPPALISQVYSEWYRASHPRGTPPPFDEAGHLATLHILLQVGQLMEDVWFGCQLDDYFNHPMNLGWINYFQRWAHAPAFRAWWPVLRPIFSPGFQRFAADHLDLVFRFDPPAARVGHFRGAIPAGLAKEWWEQRLGRPLPSNKEQFGYWLKLSSPDGLTGSMTLQVALAFVTLDTSRQVAHWSSDDFFVPPSLWASGIGSAFLHDLEVKLQQISSIQRCEVKLQLRGPKTDAGTRRERIDLIEFYKSNGYEQLPSSLGPDVLIHDLSH